MALEEPAEDDTTYEIDDITWAMPPADAGVLLGMGGLRVDHHEWEHGSYFQVARTGGGLFGC